MSSVRRLLLRLYHIARRDPAEAELSREIASHLTLLEDRFRAQGLPPDEARLAARRAFGGVEQVKELQRDARSFVWVNDAARDLRYAVRTLCAAPAFTFVAILTLALGIGAVTIIYSVIHNVVLDPLPYRDANRLVNVIVQDTQTWRIRTVFSSAELLDYREGSSVFEDVVGTLGFNAMLTGREHAESLRGVWVTPNFFDFMGLPAALGRTIVAEDGKPDAPPVAVLRHRAWVSYFGSDPDIVGKTVILNGEPHTIVGVMPPRFTWHAGDVWIPRRLDAKGPDGQPIIQNFQARLEAGVTTEQAAAQLNSIAARRAREHPGEYPESFQIQVINVIEYTVGAFSTILYTTLAAVGLLLLIACCNVANMLLARATVREREMAVRAALGAGRIRIVRQLLVESLLLGLSGAIAGCVLAYAGLDALVGLLPPNPLPGEVAITLDGAALAFSLATAVASALLFGIAPALYSARRDLVEGLKSGGRTLAGGRGSLRNVLVASEIALSLVLLLSAGLLMRTFVSLLRVDLGFDPGKIVVVPLAFAPGAYTEPADKHRFYEQVLQRITTLPGVEAAAATTLIPPYDPSSRAEVEIAGGAQSARSAIAQFCTEDYFRTLGIRIMRGRDLSPLPIGDEPRTVLINHTLAVTYFKNEDPIGRHLKLKSITGETSLEIVGIVEDVRNGGIQKSIAPHVYLSGATTGRANPVIFVRTSIDPVRMLNAIRGEIAGVDANVALRQPGSLQDALTVSLYAQPRFSLIVLGIFAVIGTVLVAIGVFSVMAYNVSRQTKEIAVRVALGARRTQVLGVVLRLGLQLLAFGTAAGLLASFATTRLIANQLWNTSPHDPMILGAATFVIAVVALAACYIPARRAMTIDPMTALRQD